MPGLRGKVIMQPLIASRSCPDREHDVVELGTPADIQLRDQRWQEQQLLQPQHCSWYMKTAKSFLGWLLFLVNLVLFVSFLSLHSLVQRSWLASWLRIPLTLRDDQTLDTTFFPLSQGLFVSKDDTRACISYLDGLMLPCSTGIDISIAEMSYGLRSQDTPTIPVSHRDGAFIYSTHINSNLTSSCNSLSACALGFDLDVELLCPATLSYIPIYYHTYHHFHSSAAEIPELISLLPLSFLTTQRLNISRFILWTNDVEHMLADADMQMLQQYFPLFQVKAFHERTQFDEAGLLPWWDSLEQYRVHHNNQSMPLTSYSDIVRLALLHNYGGVWLDTDSMLMRDLFPLLRANKPLAPSWNNNFLFIPLDARHTRTAIISLVQQFNYYNESTYNHMLSPDQYHWCYNTPVIHRCFSREWNCGLHIIPHRGVDDLDYLKWELTGYCRHPFPIFRYNAVLSFMWTIHHRVHHCQDRATMIWWYHRTMIAFVRRHFHSDGFDRSVQVPLRHQFCYENYGYHSGESVYFFQNMSICRPDADQLIVILQQRKLAVRNAEEMLNRQVVHCRQLTPFCSGTEAECTFEVTTR